MSDVDFAHLISDHAKLVKEVEAQIRSLGLMVMSKTGAFCQGFNPDIITNVGGSVDDWVIIDVINTQESLARDIGGLLVVKANIEKTGHWVRALIAIRGGKVTKTSGVKALIHRTPNFWLLELDSLKYILKALMLRSAKETVRKYGDKVLKSILEVEV